MIALSNSWRAIIAVENSVETEEGRADEHERQADIVIAWQNKIVDYFLGACYEQWSCCKYYLNDTYVHTSQAYGPDREIDHNLDQKVQPNKSEKSYCIGYLQFAIFEQVEVHRAAPVWPFPFIQY